MELEFKNHQCNHEAIVAKFKNGQLVDKLSLKAINYYSCESKFGSTGKKRKILLTETERLQYAGANFGPAMSSLDGQSTYYIGIANKKTKKVKLMDCSLFDLRPTIMGAIFDTETTSEPQVQETRSRIEQHNDLILTFGSLKSKRKTESRLKHSVESADLDSVVLKSVTGMKFEIDVAADDNNAIFPTVNRNAKSVDEIYNIRDLISAEEDAMITPLITELVEATATKIAEWRKQKRYHDFVLDLLASVPFGSDRLEKSKLILYINYLLSFLQIKKSSDQQQSKIPFQMRKLLMNKFFGDSSNPITKFTRPNPKHVYRIKAYMLAMTLIVTNYHIMDAVQIAKITGLGLTQLQTLCNGIGATWLKDGKVSQMASIKVFFPIPPLKLTTKNKKGRR